MIAILAAQNLPERHLEFLADDVEQRRVHSGDCVKSQPRRSMDTTAAHAPQEPSDRGRAFDGLDVLSYELDPELRRLSLIAPGEQMARVAVRTGRIEDTARVKALVKDEQITHIVHLAAQLMPFCQAHPVEGAMVNIVGTLNVF